MTVNHEGKVYLVMKFVAGQSLKEYVEIHGALPPWEATVISSRSREAWSMCMRRGLIHRDIKPANLRSGTIKILDMGLVFTFFQNEDDTLTQDLSKGSGAGTADYLSPEQALDCHEVDIRSDIYSLGATFYTLGAMFFTDSKITQKLVDHQIKTPPLHQFNRNIPRPWRISWPK